MIVRKPYAMFIKYFKLIHLLLATGCGYLAYRTFLVLSFITESISQRNFNLSGFVNVQLIDLWMYLIPFLLIIVLILVLSVLFYKQKPFSVYLILTGAFIVVFLFNFYLADYLEAMQLKIMPGQSLNLMRDLVFLSMVIQIIAGAKFLITSLGFDIKSFDFGKDLAELEIDEVDREEFEVEVKIDVNKARRDVARNVRGVRYAYHENQFRYNIAIIMILFMVSFVSFNTYRNRALVLATGETFFGTEHLVRVNDSYFVENNYRGRKIVDDTVLVVMKVDFAIKYGVARPLDVSKLRIKIGNYSFYHMKKYRDSLFDIGIAYEDQKISTELTSYILVFEIPSNFKKREIIFQFVDDLRFATRKQGPGIQSFAVNAIDINHHDDTYVTRMGDKIYFREPIFISYLSVESFDFKTEYRLGYNFCAKKDDCFVSYDYLKPVYEGNQERAILRLKGDLLIGETIKHLGPAYFEFLKQFGELNYVVNGTKKRFLFDREVKSFRVNVGNNVYLEVPKELVNAEQIDLVIKIRNYHYQHRLRGL